MTKPRSAEEWLCEVDAVVAAYRAGRGEPASRRSLTRDEAVAGLRRLGVGLGEAERWLDGKATREKDRSV